MVQVSSRAAKSAAELALALRRATSGRLRDLSVEDAGDRLIVRGSAPSYYVKQLAIEAVKGLTVGSELAIVVDVVVTP